MPGPFSPPGTAQDVNVTFDPSDIINVRVRNGNNTAYIEPAQEDGNLSDIKVNTDNIPPLGQAIMASSVPVAIASNQGNLPTDLKAVNGTTISVNTGATGNGSPRVTIAVDAATVAGSASLPSGTNVIGHVIADTGSTTAVTGNVTVVQPTGTNLHAVIDSGSTTAVTQATGTNLHMVVDSGTVTTVSAVTAITNALPTGSNVIGRAGSDNTTPGTTDRVSPISGQNGVAGGADNVGATTQRVVEAGASTAAGVKFPTSASSQMVLAANAARVIALIYNEGGETFWVKLGAGATTASYTLQMVPGSYYEVPAKYTGRIDVLCSGNTGFIFVTEIT